MTGSANTRLRARWTGVLLLACCSIVACPVSAQTESDDALVADIEHSPEAIHLRCTARDGSVTLVSISMTRKIVVQRNIVVVAYVDGRVRDDATDHVTITDDDVKYWVAQGGMRGGGQIDRRTLTLTASFNFGSVPLTVETQCRRVAAMKKPERQF